MPRISCVVLALLVPTMHVAAQSDWLHWRGPTQDGRAAADAKPPLRWSEDRNIRFKVPLPGLGNSSPILRGDRIYLTTAIDLAALGADADPRQAGPQTEAPNASGEHQFVVLALDRKTGREVWRRVVCSERPHEKGHRLGSHASPSIQTAGDRVIAFFGSRGLYGLDLEGKVVWSHRLGKMKTLAGFGEGSTPALHGDTVVVQWDEEGPSFVAAFDRKTGKRRWRRERDTDSSWGSPLVTEVDGKPQVILTGSGATRAYDLETGEPVWSCAGMSKNPVNSPLVADGMLVVMNSYKGRVVQAIRLAGAKGELGADAGLVWTWGNDPSYVPPPVVAKGRLYFLRDSVGLLSCLELATGEPVYRRQRLPGVKTIHASPIVVGDRIYITARKGKTLVVKAGDKLELLATNQLDDEVDATPAFVDDQVFVRGRRHLYCIAEKKE